MSETLADKFFGVCVSHEAPISSLSDQVTKYRGERAVEEFWKDVLGHRYAFGSQAANKELKRVEFHDVILTDWIPIAPGFFYTKDTWEDSINSVLIRFGDCRFGYSGNWPETRLLNIVSPRRFHAHSEVSKGVPILVTKEIYERISNELDKYGAIGIETISCEMSPIPKRYEKKLFLSRGLPYNLSIPTVEYCSSIIQKDELHPVLGIAWTICSNHGYKYAWYYFWLGSEDYNETIKRAAEVVVDIANNELGCTPLLDFDGKIRQIEGARYNPNDLMNQFREILKKNRLHSSG